MAKIKTKPLRARTFGNPYTTAQQLIVRETQFGAEHVWYGEELRLGITDLRPLVLKRDNWQCQRCGCKIGYTTAHIDHIRPVRRFKRPVDANSLDNLQTICINCHKIKTKSDQQMESRMR